MQKSEQSGSVVLVTGGASGIGLASAAILKTRGWQVVISDVDPGRTEAAASDLQVGWTTFDVSDEPATEKAFEHIESQFGPVEALVANAGLIQPGGLAEDLPLAEFDRIINVNLRGVYISCIAAGKRMVKRGAGGIVVTGSVTATRTAPLHAYAPAKAAVVHLASCLAAELGRSGVRVNAVSPGYVATPPVKAAIDRGLRDPALLRDASALGRLVEPEEIGKAVAFLLSEEASAVTGINLPVDAGWLASAHLTTYGGVRAAR